MFDQPIITNFYYQISPMSGIKSEMTSIVSEYQNMSEEEKMAFSILLEIQSESQPSQIDHDNPYTIISSQFDDTLPKYTPRKSKEPMSFKLYCETVKPLKDNTKTINNIIGNKTQLINPKSQRIINQKEKKGDKYIPIHLRTSSELRKKFDHISELRSKLKCNEQRKYQQCTFTPSIIKTHKTVNRNPNDFVKHLYKVNKQQQDKQEENTIESYLNRSAEMDVGRSLERVIEQRNRSQERLDGGKDKKAGRLTDLSNKWPNKKFNILLDIIK